MICVLVESVSPNSFVSHFIQSSPASWLVWRSDGVCVAVARPYGVLVRPDWSRERSMHKTPTVGKQSGCGIDHNSNFSTPQYIISGC